MTHDTVVPVEIIVEYEIESLRQYTDTVEWADDGGLVEGMSNPLRDAISETEFQEKVIKYAMLRKWRVHHSRPAITGGKWSTPIMGHAGLPDLVMARDYQVVLAELKSEKGTPTPEQEKWLDALGVGEVPLSPFRVDGVYGVYLWKPSDWPEIEEVLK